MIHEALVEAIAGEISVLQGFAPSLRKSPAALLWRDADLGPPGAFSPNRQCRLVEAADGWVAINLARAEDRELLPAWLGAEPDAEWDAIDRLIRGRDSAELVADATCLGLPVAAVGEAQPVVGQTASDCPPGGANDRPTVVDLSALWAGPLCASLLAEAGLAVTRVESANRPDPTRHTSPELDRRINGGKRRIALRLDDPALTGLIAGARVLVTSGRAHALARLGLTPERVFALNPGLTWIAITAHGFLGAAAIRVGFGDDCAAAGGLVAWHDGGPRFIGDALADPLTGLRAARLALEHLAEGSCGLIDVALAATAADFAVGAGLR